MCKILIDQPDVIKKILQHLGLWEESQAPPERHPPIKTGYLRSILQPADIPFSAMFAKDDRLGNVIEFLPRNQRLVERYACLHGQLSDARKMA
jgi:hypothetical protein